MSQVEVSDFSCLNDIRELRKLSVLHSSSSGLHKSWTV